MEVHKGQCPCITGRKQCRGTLFPAGITVLGTLFIVSYYQEEKSAGVHSILPVSRLGEKSARVHSFFSVAIS